MLALMRFSKNLCHKATRWQKVSKNLAFYSTDKNRQLWKFQYNQEGEGRAPKDDVSKKGKERSNLPVEIGIFLRQEVDFSFRGFKNWWKKFKFDAEAHSQRYIPERQECFGPELGTAHFVVSCGGTVKFFGTDKWFGRDKSNQLTLPTSYVQRVAVEAVDLQNTDILYEGLVNIATAEKIKWLSIKNCQFVDDWFLDNLAQFKNSLEYLDISDCNNVTEKGVCALHRLRNLKTLKLENLPKIQHPELVCLLLEDVLPSCKIEGISYMDNKLLSDG